ncbi:MAG: putative quinol monooxygenase [Elusimicrobiota bacterium]
MEVVLNLEVEVSPENRERFFDFCRRAFPVYESNGGNRMALYEDASHPGRFNESGYYRTMADYKRSEAAIGSDPEQVRLIGEWRALLSAPPKVTVYRKSPA